MNITDELIERFFQDKCNAEEAEAVVAYLNDQQDMTEKYLGEQEWIAYQPAERLHPVVTEKMLSGIRKSTYGVTGRRTWLRYVAAAAVLIAIGFGVNYFIGVNSRDVTEAVAIVEKDSAPPVLKLIRNNTKNIQEIKLADGSTVILEANSELRYYEPFESDRRRMFLNGEALFKVAKDAGKPFTVFSSELATTALGTEFRVTAFEKTNLITVKLYEGKVVIKDGEGSAKKLNKDYFLIPGDEFTYNRTTMMAAVMKIGKPAVVAKQRNADAKKGNDEPNWYMFNNQKLSQVFDQLSAIYNVKIVYSGAELSKMSFIGKIDQSDSLENILNDIALLNNLTIKKTGTAYTVRKK